MTIPEQAVALLPCPFCGCEPSIEMTGFHLNGRTIYCASDDCMGPHTTAANLVDATVQWNKRAQPLMGVQRLDRDAVARSFFEAGQKKALEHGHHLLPIGWEQPGEEADQIRSLFLAGADAVLAMIAEERTEERK